MKSVSLGEGEFAYQRRRGTRFELHATPEDGDSLQDPEVDDLVVLTQHDQVTHLIRVVSSTVEPRPKRTMQKGTRDHRFSVQRTCEVVLVCSFDIAACSRDAFGFEPNAGGGEVFLIRELPSYVASDQPMWAVQRRIVQAMSRADAPKRPPREEPMRPMKDKRGRVERPTK